MLLPLTSNRLLSYIVSLSISGETVCQASSDRALAFRDIAVWYPDIPNPCLSFLGIDSLHLVGSDVDKPLSVVVLGG